MDFSAKVAAGFKFHVFSRNRRGREKNALTRTRIKYTQLLGPNQWTRIQEGKITHKNRRKLENYRDLYFCFVFIYGEDVGDAQKKLRFLTAHAQAFVVEFA